MRCFCGGMRTSLQILKACLLEWKWFLFILKRILVFQISVSISSRLVAYLVLVFFYTAPSSSTANCLNLTTSEPLRIFVLFVSDFKIFSSIFLKCSFHVKSLSSWPAASSFVHDGLILLLTSFTVGHGIRNCLSSIDFFINLALNAF